MNSTHPELRKDIKITRQVQSDGVHYVIKDPIVQEYYRFPESEFCVISLFDGTRSFNQIVEDFNHNNSDFEIDCDTVREFYDSLDKIHLMNKPLAERNLFILEQMREQRKKKLLSTKGSIMYFRISLFDPDRLLNRIYPNLKWIFTKRFMTIAFLAILTAVIMITYDSGRFLDGMKSITTFSDKTPLALFSLWITVVIVILLHELGHAFTCKHFGGEVHEIGILFLFFTPCFYANVNDAWLFEKKSSKLWVTFAGGITEFMVGTIAVFIWFFVNQASPLSAICYQIMTICALSTVMFNFNPLMKLDGYYAFSDFVGIPNLKTQSSSYANFFLKKHLFRMSVEDTFENSTTREKRIMLIYGIASIIYMTGVMTGLFFMIQKILIDSLSVTGALLSLFIAWKLFKGYLMKFIGFIKKNVQEKLPVLKKHPVIGVTLISTALSLLIFCISNVSLTIQKNCTLVPASLIKLYAGESGFIEKSFALSGKKVEKNELISIINNSDKKEEYEKTIIQYEKENLKRISAMSTGDNQTFAMSENRLKELKSTIFKMQKEFKACSVTAPVSGVILTDNTNKGYYPFFTKGSELLTIASTDSFFLDLTLLENEIGDIKSGDKADIRLRSNPSNLIEGTVYSKAPVSGEYAQSSSQNVTQEKHGIESEFNIRILLTLNNGLKLLPDMSGTVKIRAGKVKGITMIGRELVKLFRADLFF